MLLYDVVCTTCSLKYRHSYLSLLVVYDCAFNFSVYIQISCINLYKYIQLTIHFGFYQTNTSPARSITPALVTKQPERHEQYFSQQSDAAEVSLLHNNYPLHISFFCIISHSNLQYLVKNFNLHILTFTQCHLYACLLFYQTSCVVAPITSIRTVDKSHDRQSQFVHHKKCASEVFHYRFVFYFY